MNLYVNSIIEWSDTQNTERILHNDGEFVVTISIFSGKGIPEIRRYDELKGAFFNGSFRVLEKDPYTHFLIPEAQILDKHKRRRDEAWELIREIVEPVDLNIFNPRIRGKLIAEVAKKKTKT